MSDFETRLNRARVGGGILFCGAGFTADCLNFTEPNSIGTGSQLLELFNSELKAKGHPHGFRELRNAAESYEEFEGQHGLMALLKQKYSIQNVSSDIVDILQFPWRCIYTTNYDNGIQLGLTESGPAPRTLTNLDKPQEFPETGTIVHLHGAAEKWDITNFKLSAILDASSYYRAETILNEWLEIFRVDIERSDFVAFIGFNANDFHLNQVLFNASGLREKIYFINRPSAAPDPDVKMTQSRFGTPLYIGRPGFAKHIRDSLKSALPTEPSTANFRRYTPQIPSSSLPRVDEIEDLFLFGKINFSQIARDNLIRKSDYHILRNYKMDLLKLMDENISILMISGDICDGKSIIIDELASALSTSRPVYVLRHPYNDLLDEVARILHTYPSAVLVIENCFDIREERLDSLARMFDNTEGKLLLTSRSIALEAETTSLRSLEKFAGFLNFRIPKLDDNKIEELVTLIDQIAGWRKFWATSKSEKVRFIQKSCERNLPGFLLRLLKSEYVRDSYKEEYNKVQFLNKQQKTSVIISLYISHIGEKVHLSFLSNALFMDVGETLDHQASKSDGLRLVRRIGEYV